MPVLLNYFVVEGRFYDLLPGEWERASELGVRKQIYPTLDLKHITVIQQAPTTSDTFIERRKVHRQGWKATWTSESIMNRFQRDHYETAYFLQKSFWIQYDDEMSRENAVLEQIGTDYQAYFTPTFPIAPYGYTVYDKTEYPGTVFVNGVPRYTGFSVDSEIGMVRFATPLAPTDVVQMKYTWKAYVRVDSVDLKPHVLANDIYVGQVTFVQEKANYQDDAFPIILPWEGTLAGTLPSGSTLNSHATFGWGDTRDSVPYSNYWSAPSGATMTSLPGVGV